MLGRILIKGKVLVAGKVWLASVGVVGSVDGVCLAATTKTPGTLKALDLVPSGKSKITSSS